jgi:hypothetical protein
MLKEACDFPEFDYVSTYKYYYLNSEDLDYEEVGLSSGPSHLHESGAAQTVKISKIN